MPSTHQPSIGIDFGTTNSSVAIATGNGAVELVSFPSLLGPTPSFRSVLYLEQLRQAGRTVVKSYTGPSAIEHYLEAERENPGKGRLIQSLKSYLPSQSLTGTEVFGKRYAIEDLISRILTDLRLRAEQHLGTPIRTATVGRPVRFVSAETPEDDAFATNRLRATFEQAGFEQITFELEPIAAAYAYAATLTHDELILIGDFGGGTSDFSLLKVGPANRGTKEILGNSGLGLAGDAFDARIVRKLVSPALGSDSLERTYSHAVDRPAAIIPAVPAWIYANLERWHYLSFLKTRNVTEILKSARLRAQEPEKVAALITLIDEDLGYQLHQAVQRLKVALSHNEAADFHFRDGSMDITAQVTRADFELWIADELASIESCVDDLLTTTKIAPEKVDRVFLTGGTSFVPAVRRIFERRFTPARIRTGNEFTSVAQGLALRAAETR
ncbi:MAG: Hsp70 family protein [Granulicella sp.]